MKNIYLKLYFNLIKKAKGRIKPTCYVEEHHCKPRCMKGSNEKRNLVYLTAKEHYYAHKWLTFIFPKNNKIRNAWTMMCWIKDDNQQRFKVSAEDYERARIKFSKIFQK
jgi:hypothetical protein